MQKNECKKKLMNVIRICLSFILAISIISKTCPDNPLCLSCSKVSSKNQCLNCQNSFLDKKSGDCMLLGKGIARNINII